MIDLHAAMETYNREHKTNYVTILEFAQDVYDKYQSIVRVGWALCISASAVHTSFTQIGVKFKPKGHRGTSGRLNTLLSSNTCNMTLDELVKVSDLSKSYIKTVLKKHHRTYKKDEPYKWNRRVVGHNMSKIDLEAHGFLRSKAAYRGDTGVREI